MTWRLQVVKDGERNDASQDFLSQGQPRIAVISVSLLHLDYSPMVSYTSISSNASLDVCTQCHRWALKSGRSPADWSWSGCDTETAFSCATSFTIPWPLRSHSSRSSLDAHHQSPHVLKIFEHLMNLLYHSNSHELHGWDYTHCPWRYVAPSSEFMPYCLQCCNLTCSSTGSGNRLVAISCLFGSGFTAPFSSFFFSWSASLFLVVHHRQSPPRLKRCSHYDFHSTLCSSRLWTY